MSQLSQTPELLDLSITLTPPPKKRRKAAASAEVIASITVRCDALGLTQTGDLLTDPLTKQDREELRWYLEEYWQWPFEGFAQRGKQIENLLPQIGRRLYKAVFGKVEANNILQAWRLKPGEVQRQISIMSDIPRALSLPWELLHDEQGFLVLRARHPVSLVRRLPQRELAGFSTPFEPPLRVLLVTARPDDAGFVDPRGIARELFDELQNSIEAGTIAVEFLRPPTLPALRARLSDTKRPPIHILHFDGHGAYEPEEVSQDGLLLSGGKGVLAFENKEGQLELINADDLAAVLLDSSVELAVLNACQSAVGSAKDAMSSVAARLIGGGVDAVAAMGASVLVVSAAHFVEAFYREIANGTPVLIAQERARQALHDDRRRHVHRRNRDEEGKPVELRDWWLPHFYQQRPLVLRATRPSGALTDSIAAPTVRLNQEMPAEPRYGFSGRARELLQIERYLMRGKLVVIQGFGGVGKTALAREAADWLTRTGMYVGACFVPFEHGGDATTLLSALGHFLGIYDSNYNPNDPTAALAGLKPALKERGTLVIADNLESLLPNGEAPLEAGARGQLWEVLLELTKLGAGVLLTSRDTAFGDGRMAPGKYVAFLPLEGLSPDDAYTLASRLLEDLGIDRARAPYKELRDLLKQLDYHPLAIQLVLPTLSKMSLATIKADFAELLPKFTDDTATGRNRSLLASLEYSLQRLSAEQRALLPRLALFEGGANENELLEITEIPEGEWVTLRPALEQAALLTAEQVHEDITIPFLHFHPVLAPYLRNQPGADDAALRERYAQRYGALAHYLSEEDTRHPQPVRALVRRELPNLRRALELLLEASKLDAAADMENSIARFLNFFGLGRERDELRRKVAEAFKNVQGGALTWAEYLRENGLGEDEWRQGNLRAAYTRFSRLLESIVSLSEGTPLGRGSYEHCYILWQLARCLKNSRQSTDAEKRLREALVIIEVLIKQQPDNQIRIRHRGLLLTELGDVLRDQGKYPQAREAYGEALKVVKQQADLRAQGVVQAQLGTLAQEQGDYAEAWSRHQEALDLFRSLGEPAVEAAAWCNLGIVAQEQEEWAEAERCYREGLALWERQSDAVSAAKTCNQLAIVAVGAGRPTEAESWYKRVLELDDRVQPGSPSNASHLSNLANLLKNEVQAGRVPVTRLAEARGYGERALAMRETLDASSEIWQTLNILADIAEMEGRADEARNYRRRERETFAAFEGNRYHIDRRWGEFILDVVAGAKGDMRARERVEADLPDAEANGWRIAGAVQRILAGERDWDALVEGLEGEEALMVLRALETIDQPGNAPSSEMQNRTPEEVFASLPVAIREALEREDEEAFDQAFEVLSDEEQQVVVEALDLLQEWTEEEEGEGEGS
jgi:tetratricopeptide (TPR) repeat protein